MPAEQLRFVTCEKRLSTTNRMSRAIPPLLNASDLESVFDQRRSDVPLLVRWGQRAPGSSGPPRGIQSANPRAEAVAPSQPAHFARSVPPCQSPLTALHSLVIACASLHWLSCRRSSREQQPAYRADRTPGFPENLMSSINHRTWPASRTFRIPGLRECHNVSVRRTRIALGEQSWAKGCAGVAAVGAG